jgi:predicted HAD superfamily Cof-like phosphohydrolase
VRPDPYIKNEPPRAHSTSSDNDRYAPQSSFLAASISFHEAFDLPREASPTIEIDESLAKLRIALLEEEVTELVDAVAEADLVAIADALADIVYVAYGTAVTYGINLDAVLNEVHRSNMSKLDKDGRPIIRDDGKVIKSDQYSPPDIAAVLKLQQPLLLGTPSHTGHPNKK